MKGLPVKRKQNNAKATVQGEAQAENAMAAHAYRLMQARDLIEEFVVQTSPKIEAKPAKAK